MGEKELFWFKLKDGLFGHLVSTAVRIDSLECDLALLTSLENM